METTSHGIACLSWQETQVNRDGSTNHGADYHTYCVAGDPASIFMVYYMLGFDGKRSFHIQLIIMAAKSSETAATGCFVGIAGTFNNYILQSPPIRVIILPLPTCGLDTKGRKGNDKKNLSGGLGIHYLDESY